jgi:hypothetical protein
VVFVCFVELDCNGETFCSVVTTLATELVAGIGDRTSVVCCFCCSSELLVLATVFGSIGDER